MYTTRAGVRWRKAFFNQLAGSKATAVSAGTDPATEINPEVAKAMLELGIDISHQKPKQLTLGMMESADRVITIGCGVEGVCPASFVPTEDWELADPHGKPVEEVRAIRDQIKERVEALLKTL